MALLRILIQILYLLDLQNNGIGIDYFCSVIELILMFIYPLFQLRTSKNYPFKMSEPISIDHLSDKNKYDYSLVLKAVKTRISKPLLN